MVVVTEFEERPPDLGERGDPLLHRTG